MGYSSVVKKDSTYFGPEFILLSPWERIWYESQALSFRAKHHFSLRNRNRIQLALKINHNTVFSIELGMQTTR